MKELLEKRIADLEAQYKLGLQQQQAQAQAAQELQATMFRIQGAATVCRELLGELVTKAETTEAAIAEDA